ncbi:MAG: hypothetical protein WAV32_08420 [Halobacteriota archaeon]
MEDMRGKRGESVKLVIASPTRLNQEGLKEKAKKKKGVATDHRR